MKYIFTSIILFSTFVASAQELPKIDLGELHGNFQLDAQYYLVDSAIDAPVVSDKIRNNGYLNLNYRRGKFFAGIRYENYQNPLLGYDSRYKGSGIMYKQVGYTTGGLEVTAGSFYEQFGSGMALRAFNDYTIGIDNALEGIRLRYTPTKGIMVKGLIGRQRQYFTYGEGIVRGLDAEFNMNSIFTSLNEAKLNYTLGFSGVSKYQIDNNPLYKIPENVGVVAGRLNISGEKFFVNGEYAYKNNDPSLDNNLIYRTGKAAIVSTGFTSKTISASITGKRNDNFSFRSDRNAAKLDLTTAYLSTAARQHSYQLAALYPYSTQPLGEVGFQAQIDYKFRKNTPLGGKYGTTLAFNYTEMYGLDTTRTTDGLGYTTNGGMFGNDDLYFKDFNIELQKKINKKNKISLTYLYQIYNKNVIEGKSGYNDIISHIAIFEHQYQFAKKYSVRYELQHMQVNGQDKGNWAFGLVEFSLASHYFISLIDNFNYVTTSNTFTYHNEEPGKPKRQHYYFGQFAYAKDALRIAISYGRQREGIVCVGGICRFVPASNGLGVSVSSSF